MKKLMPFWRLENFEKQLEEHALAHASGNCRNKGVVDKEFHQRKFPELIMEGVLKSD